MNCSKNTEKNIPNMYKIGPALGSLVRLCERAESVDNKSMVAFSEYRADIIEPTKSTREMYGESIWQSCRV